ncbi:MAG: alpha/beta hydrolase [Anaerolineaceae bacterium]|nr:alpha/beta hydrolase [Anaerolineaceae bacterium]
MHKQWQHDTLTANGIQIYYSRSGGNKPSIILSHGATDDGSCWTRVAELLAEEYDVIMPDARGHGKSEIGHGEYGVLARAEDLSAFIDALKLDQPFIMGHSMGAQTSLFAAAKYGEKIRAVILEDPLLILEGEGIFGKTTAEELGKMMQDGARRSKRSFKFLLRSYARRNLGWSDDEIKPWVESKKRLSNDFIKSLTRMKQEPEGFETLGKVKCPALLFTGNRRKGCIVSEKGTEKAKRILPHLEVARFDAGHNIRREAFEAYMQEVKQFLSSVE